MLNVHVVLDGSGSMNSIKDDTIGAFNSYVETLAKETPDAILSLTVFDSRSVETIINSNKVSDIKPLTDKDYRPGGMTPLYDAIGKVVDMLDKTFGENKALVILTDGQENCSREYTRDSIKKLLDEKQKNDNWLVIFLGANQDAFVEGGKIGTQSASTMTFNAARISNTMKSAARATKSYALSGNLMDAAFTSDERDASS